MLKNIISVLVVSLAVSGCVAERNRIIRTEYKNTVNFSAMPAAQIDQFFKERISKRPYFADEMCGAYYNKRRHKEFQSCHNAIIAYETETGKKIEGKPKVDAMAGELYMEVGQLEKARTLLEPIAAWDGVAFANINKHLARAHAQRILPSLYLLMGEKEKARQHAAKIEERLNSGLVRFASGLDSGDLPFKTARARMALVRGDHGKAYEYITEGYQVGLGSFVRLFDFAGVDKVGKEFDENELNYIYMYAYTAYKTNRYKEAKKSYGDLLKHKVFSRYSSLHYNAYYHLGDIARSENNVAQAIDYFQKAVDVIESERSSINSEASRIGFVGNKQAVYADLVSLLIEQGRYADAFEYAERGKSRALVDTLASKQQFAAKGSAANSAQLLAELDTAENASRTMIAANATTAGSATRGISVVDKKKAIQTANVELASLVTVSAPSSADIQKQLQRNETIVEYYGEGDTLFAFVLSRTGIQAVALGGKNIGALVSRYRKSLSSPQSTDHQQSAQALYDAALKPVSSYIQSQYVTVVPHGALHYAPFAALYDGTQYLVDKYQLRVLPSASVLSFLNKPVVSKSGTLLALGNPDLGDPKLDLPGAQEEALQVAKLSKGAKVLLRKNATETALKTYGPQFRQIHFAMHGQFDDKEPLASGLLMAKDGQNDGRLTVSELYELNLDADLVTLSACQTALGETASGDDVIGFTRGFLYAGAHSIVSSLWEVDDAATRDLMVGFYKNLGKYGKGQALQNAQQKVKAVHAHPYYWAAFQLTGKS